MWGRDMCGVGCVHKCVYILVCVCVLMCIHERAGPYVGPQEPFILFFRSSGDFPVSTPLAWDCRCVLAFTWALGVELRSSGSWGRQDTGRQDTD